MNVFNLSQQLIQIFLSDKSSYYLLFIFIACFFQFVRLKSIDLMNDDVLQVELFTLTALALVLVLDAFTGYIILVKREGKRFFKRSKFNRLFLHLQIDPNLSGMFQAALTILNVLTQVQEYILSYLGKQ
ncbi:unnamed protein product [Paramecium octaurelia]|uniref:Uncharacterized protein n=1 Tax=Paramecium octaurelia TaxID=43137 RepID=A0A8S1YP95_PAROT|nr:unnamed protein product [Paramecium octaurelia]